VSSRPIVRSIWITVGWLFAVQLAISLSVIFGYGVSWSESTWYLIVTPVLHGAVAVVLASLSKLWVNVDTDEELSRVNVANALSIARVSSAPTLLWLVLIARSYAVVPVLVPLAAVVFLTDLLDGQISRRTRQITRIGRYLDSSSDYTVLFIVAVALVSYDLIALWLFVIVMLRFGLQLLGQVALFIMQRMRIQFRTSFLGKASVFAVMFFFALSLLRLLDGLPGWFDVLYTGAEYLVAAIAVVSLAEKAFLFVVDARNARK
jgi:phosphatidylglycerophosphate synthase